MTQNVGTVDARIRLVLAAALFVVAIVFNNNPLLALGAAFVALILAGTALTRRCPLYKALRVSTEHGPRPHTA